MVNILRFKSFNVQSSCLRLRTFPWLCGELNPWLDRMDDLKIFSFIKVSTKLIVVATHLSMESQEQLELAMYEHQLHDE